MQRYTPQELCLAVVESPRSWLCYNADST